MRTPTPCHDAFAVGQDQRRRVPLREGRYKIRDGLLTLKRMRQTVELIKSNVRHRVKFKEGEDLVMCTADDRGAFLKRLPATIARTISHAILPGIAALEGDGVPTAVVATAVQRSEAQASALLQDCEHTHALLKQGIRQEYAAMWRGESHLLDLLTQAENIAREALDLAEAARHA